MRYALLACALVALVVTACGGSDSTVTPAPTATRIVSTPTAPTATAIPTQAAAPTQPAPTATTSVAATAVPTARPSPTPAATPTPIGTPTPAAGQPRRGGVVTMGDTPTINKSFQVGIRNAALGDANPNMSRLVYQSMFGLDTYANEALAGVLVDQWEIAKGADQVTLRLHKDAVWSDGKPVISQDVKFSLEAYISPPRGFVVTGTAGTLKNSVAGIEVIDDKTLLIKLKAPDVSFVSTVADPDAVIRPAHRTLEQSATDPVGSGPYLIKEVQTDVKSVFTRNGRYWMKDHRNGNMALPYLDGIEDILFADLNQGYAAMTTGRVDVLHGSFGIAITGKEKDLATRLPKAFLQFAFRSAQGWGFQNVPPFNAPEFIQAMNLLTDRLALVEFGFAGGGVIDDAGHLPGASGNAWALPSKETLAAPGWRYLHRQTGELALDPFKLKEGQTSVYKKDPKDIEKAKTLLRQIGLDPDKGQFPNFKLLVEPRNEPKAVVFQQSLKEFLGVTIQIENVDAATAAKRGADGQFTAIIGFPHPASGEPTQTLRPYTTGNGAWKHGFQLPEFDALFVKQKAEVDPAKRKDLVWEFQRRILAGHPVITAFGTLAAGGVVREYVKNWEVPKTSTSNSYAHDRAWLER